MMKDFFIITTLVNFVMFVLGSVYRTGTTFSYEILLYPPMYGFAGTLPQLLIYSRKELSVKQMMFRKILQFVVLEALLLFITFFGVDMDPEIQKSILPFAGSVLVVYLLVILINWFLDKRTADALMEDLSAYQKEV